MLTNHQKLTDTAAIALSFLCTLHCLALPLILTLIPGMAVLSLDNEAVHLWLIVAAIPTSAYALTLGCRQHRQAYIPLVSAFGIVCLFLALFWAHEIFGDAGEKALTLIGAWLVAYGHYRNYKLCQHENCCA